MKKSMKKRRVEKPKRKFDQKLHLMIDRKSKAQLMKGCRKRGLSVSQLIRLVASIL